MKAAKIANAVVCEDVRTEQNGKQIIIGVYSGDIVVSNVPAFIPVMLWLQLDDIGTEPEEYEFRGTVYRENFVSGKFKIATTLPNSRATISLGQFPLQVTKDGELSFDLRPAAGKRWKNAITLKLRVSPSPTA